MRMFSGVLAIVLRVVWGQNILTLWLSGLLGGACLGNIVLAVGFLAMHA